MSDENKYPAIIISGMHRSGTSLTASLMAALSVHLGDHLLPADSNNRRGYFEDLKFLRFHQRVLSQLCPSDEPGHADWGWTESENLDISRFREFRDQAQRLLIAGNRKAGPWGWKDPRTTLFLDFWDSLLDHARYVLVYRFPWDVADSMQRLGFDLFLGNPEYAYRIWTFYNRRLRDFYVQHADRCVLVSTNALQGNLEKFASLIGDKLCLPARESRLEEVFESGLFGTISGQDPLIDLVAAAYPDCTRLLSELDELADLSGAGLWQARPVRSRLSRPDATDEGPIDLSVVTPCYEQGTLLLEAIASVERHAPPRCELIIVNDGSRQPKTLEILDLLKRCGYFVVDQENAGLSAARNKAIGLARGRYILPLDDDNRIREGFLAEAISVLDGSPEIGIVNGDRNLFGFQRGIDQRTDFDLDKLLENNYIDACAVLRKQVWIDCQGYDPLMCPADDWELWIHAAALGWRFHHIPQVTFDYRVRPGSLIFPFRSVEKQQGYRKRIRVKHSELYWAKAIKELEAVKQLLADQTDEQNRLKDERDLVVSELEVARAQIAARDREIRTRDRESQLVRSKMALKEQELQDLSIRIADHEARIERMTGSLGWRLLNCYGRFKYRYLLPVYRLFSQIPDERTEPKPMRSNSEKQTLVDE